MLQFFEPVVAKIIKMLDRQVRLANQEGDDCKINRVILVGGFGDSLHLEKRIRTWCESQGNIRVLCPEHP
jgi:hypothetical protein